MSNDQMRHDQRLAEREMAQRRARARYLPHIHLTEYMWYMLLFLFVEQRNQVTVGELCIASNAPRTTALRHIGLLEENGLIVRRPHDHDARSDYLFLTDRTMRELQGYFYDQANGRF